MFSESFYRVLHYISLFFFLSGVGVSFFSDQNSKLNKIVTGVFSLLIFVAGMGLILRALGISHGESWPGWLHAKITIWLVLSIATPVLSKRLKKGRVAAFYGIVSLAAVAAWLAVNKPF